MSVTHMDVAEDNTVFVSLNFSQTDKLICVITDSKIVQNLAHSSACYIVFAK